jgi:WD40 repeat protein/uncharacterized caspase-like protein
MRQCFPLLILLICRHVGAQEPAAAPPILVLDAGGHTAPVSKVLFSPDGRELITVSHDKTFRTWDVASGEPLRVLRLPVGPGDEGQLNAAAMSRDGLFLAVGGLAPPPGPGRIYVLSAARGRVERVLNGHTGAITSLAFARMPRGRHLLASGSEDKTARLWHPATGRPERVLEGHTDAVTGVAFAPAGDRLVTTSLDRTARIWAVADGRCEGVLTANQGSVRCVAWSPDGATLATGGPNRSIRLWRTDGSLARSFEGLEGPVLSIVFSANSRELLYTWTGAGSGDGAAFMDIGTGRKRVQFGEHRNAVNCGAISPDGAIAATAGGASHEVYVWKTSNAATVHRLASRGRIGRSAGWSTDGGTIAWGYTSNSTSDNQRGPLEHTFRLSDLQRGGTPDTSYRRSVEVRGSFSLARAGPGIVAVKQGDNIVAKLVQDTPVRCFTFLGGDRAAVGSGGSGAGKLHLFDTRDGTMVRSFESQEGVVWAVAPSPDGRYLLTASGDQTLRIWVPDRDRPLLTIFFGGDDWIAWTPEGYYAASPGGENLMGWQISNGPDQVGNFAPASQFHSSLYRPDVIKLLLTTGSVARALEVLSTRGKETQARRKPGRPRVRAVQEVIPPVVAITKPDSNGARLDKAELEVRAAAMAQPGHPVTAFRLLLDGRPFDGDRGRKEVPNDPTASRQKTASWQVRLEPGRHRLAVIAESAVSNGQSDEIEVIYEEQRAQRPRLYVVAIGVSNYPGPLRLRYASDDARAVESVFRAKSGPLFESIETRSVVDQDATRGNILKSLAWLRQTMRDQDVGLFFFSGHGAFRDSSFYMLSVDADVNDLETTAVPGDQLKSNLARTKGKLVVLLDACHSGAQAAMLPPRTPIRRIEWSQPVIPVGRLRLPNSLVTRFQRVGFQQEGEKQLRPSTDELVRALSNDEHGVITMSSSTGSEVSVESAALKHGYFTQALTEGLSGKADINNDGDVYLTELDAYLVNRVKDLSNDSQHPVTARPAGVRPFPLSRPRP